MVKFRFKIRGPILKKSDRDPIKSDRSTNIDIQEEDVTDKV